MSTLAPENQNGHAAAGSAMPGLEACRRARLSRDPRFDGRFFIGVLTTGVYCRPTCPARMPAEANVRYFASAAQAVDAGFRPCLRCRPETARALPEWTLSTGTVLRALRLIESGYLNHRAVRHLAAEVDVGERHLARLFKTELGSSPQRFAQLNRARVARSLLVGTAMKHADIAFHSGYGSVSRFNAEIRSIYKRPPGELRSRRRLEGAPWVEIRLPVRAPYAFDWVFGYLAKRALQGLERVDGGPGEWCYLRRLRSPGDAPVWLSVAQQGEELLARIPLVDEPVHSLLGRVRRVFDLNADGAAVHDDLRTDPDLGHWVQRAPGLRVPGAWDGFETAVRAVLGQQVSVARGTELADRMVERYAAGSSPAPTELMHRDVAELGMPGRRGRAVARLAQLVQAGELAVDECQDYDLLNNQLQAIDGVGPWTANYIRMRVLKDPDAFPDNDWVVLKQLGCTAAQARRRADAWRPWRAYALMYLWYAAGVQREQGGR